MRPMSFDDQSVGRDRLAGRRCSPPRAARFRPSLARQSHCRPGGGQAAPYPERVTREPVAGARSQPLVDPLQSNASGPFGLAAFEQDDRLRLFAFANAEKSRQYLWVLRAIE